MAATSACKMKTGEAVPKLSIVSMPGSHYVGKVIMGLDAVGVPWTPEFIAGLNPPKELAQKKKKDAQGNPAKTVPILEIASWKDKPKTIVSGSDNILQWVDDNVEARFKFYPDGFDKVRELESKFDRLGLWIIFWHWVSDVGYGRTIRVKVGSFLPRCVRCCITADALPPIKFNRKRFRELIGKAMPEVFISGSQDVDEDKALELFMEEMAQIDAMFETDDQKFVAKTPNPSAADMMLIACLHSFADHLGDADIPPAVPGLLDHSDLQRLNKYFRRMKSEYPLYYDPKKNTGKGKE